MSSYLLHVVAGLRAGLDEHDTQFFGPLFPFLNGYLPGNEGERGNQVAERQPLAEVEETA